MSLLGDYSDIDEELTPEERKLLEDAEGMQQFGGATGSAIGTALGTAASFIPALTPFAPLIVPAAGAIGGWAGGMIGGEQARKAAEKYEKLREERLKPLQERQRRLATLNQLAGDFLPNIRGL